MSRMIEADTICALSSAPGRGGVAVIRVSGPRAREVVVRMAGELGEPRKAVLRSIAMPETGEEVDRAIVLWFAGPSSFTGEDVAEIHPHGGRAIVASVLTGLIGLGCRLAEPGEFARRAFENGKIDLTEAEGLADLIDAETEAQRRQASLQASGALGRLYDGWREALVSALALTEASIDFSDEADVSLCALEDAREIVLELAEKIAAHLQDGRRGEILREGFKVVLAGAPNVGKSSLLNALARREAAIVSTEAGTTRDVIEVRLDVEGLPVIVSDTAGLREAQGEVEREGIRRTLERGRAADLVIWLTEAAAPQWQLPAELSDAQVPVLRVANKADVLGSHQRGPLPDLDQVELGQLPAGDVGAKRMFISAQTGEGVTELTRRMASLARQRIEPGEAPVITQVRHRRAVEDCLGRLQDYLSQDGQEAELRAEDLRLAANALGRITGKVDAEQVLDRIFARFCIGK